MNEANQNSFLLLANKPEALEEFKRFKDSEKDATEGLTKQNIFKFLKLTEEDRE